jgi:hypothetical protein
MGLSLQRPAQGFRKNNVLRFTPGNPAASATLQGWKEIATELGRSVRTVQRWQRKLGLPVHKLGEGVGSPVFAFKDELRAWLRVKAEEAASEVASFGQDERSLWRRQAALVNRRETLDPKTMSSEPEIVRSLNAFFALKNATNNSPSCNHCHAPTRLLVGHFWLYGTERTWQVAVPFCPQCDSELRAMLPQPPERLA